MFLPLSGLGTHPPATLSPQKKQLRPRKRPSGLSRHPRNKSLKLSHSPVNTAKSEQPVFSGGASETVAESAGELTDPEAQFSVVYANCANWPPILNQHGMYFSRNRSQSDALSEVGSGEGILKVLVRRDLEFCVY